MKLVLAEKPSVAQSIANVLGANKREDGYLAWSNLLRLFFYACKEDRQMAKGIENRARSPPSVQLV